MRPSIRLLRRAISIHGRAVAHVLCRTLIILSQRLGLRHLPNTIDGGTRIGSGWLRCESATRLYSVVEVTDVQEKMGSEATGHVSDRPPGDLRYAGRRGRRPLLGHQHQPSGRPRVNPSTSTTGDLRPGLRLPAREDDHDDEDLVRWSAAADDYTTFHFDPEVAHARGSHGPVVHGTYQASLNCRDADRLAWERREADRAQLPLPATGHRRPSASVTPR